MIKDTLIDRVMDENLPSRAKGDKMAVRTGRRPGGSLVEKREEKTWRVRMMSFEHVSGSWPLLSTAPDFNLLAKFRNFLLLIHPEMIILSVSYSN